MQEVTPAPAERRSGPAESYLDAASGEPLHPAAAEIMERAAAAGHADPRRLHFAGRRARLMLDNARASVAESLGVRADEVTFTPSGTHAVHLGLLGLARPGSHLAVSAVEHSSVIHAAEWHVVHGGHYSSIPVDAVGRVQAEGLATISASRPVDVIAVQAANHEVGTIQPVDALTDGLDAGVFVDACAAGGRLPLPRRWDAAALSAHKWGGPAGVGVLLVRKRSAWRNPFPGDDRADERATGFENVVGALAAAAALSDVAADTATSQRQRVLVDRIRTAAARIPDVDVVGDPVDRLPHLVTLSFLYVEGDALVTELDRAGFGIASGSACTASTLQPSHVLAAMGALTHGNARISLTRDTTEAEIDRFLAVLPDVVERLRAENLR